MVAAPEARRQALMVLRTAELMLADLPEIASEWDTIDVGERIGWSLDWGNEMAGIGRLAQYAADGVLGPEERDRYLRLLHGLKAVVPIIDRLDLRRPMVPLPA